MIIAMTILWPHTVTQKEKEKHFIVWTKQADIIGKISTKN